MKRKFLTALGLEKDIIDQIMDEHGITIETMKAKSTEAQDALNETITTLKADIVALKSNSGGDGTNWKADAEEYKLKFENLETEFNTFKDNSEKEKTEELTKQVVSAQLLADGANPKLVGLLIKEFDLSAVELEGDETAGFKPKDWETISKAVKETYADVFGEIKTKGAYVPTPPPGSPSVKNPWLKESRNLEEQTRIYREDPALAQSLARAAGVDL